MTKEKYIGEIPSDNRFEIIAKAKVDLLNATNINTSSEEMKVLDNFLFRCWQMGWLKKYDTKLEKIIIEEDKINDEQKLEFEKTFAKHCEELGVSKLCRENKKAEQLDTLMFICEDFITSLDKQNNDFDWKSFRAEAAKDILIGIVAHSGVSISNTDVPRLTKLALTYANELIKQLKETIK